MGCTGKTIRDLMLGLGFTPTDVEAKVDMGPSGEVTAHLVIKATPMSEKDRKAREGWVAALTGERWQRTRLEDP